MIADQATLAASRERSQVLARDWQASAAWRRVAQSFAGVDQADAAALAAAAETLLADDALVPQLFAPLIAALVADPWFEPPFRFTRDALRSAAVLFATPTVSLVTTVLSADALASLPNPCSVTLSGRLAVTRYVAAGGAHLRRWRADPIAADFTSEGAAPARVVAPLTLCDGMVVRHDGREQGHLIAGAGCDMAMLTVTIQPQAAPFAREYACADGRLLRVAMVDEASARTQMLLTLLRLSDRRDAGAVFDRAAAHPAFFQRWSAMREWLALDAAAALPRLRAMTRDDHPEVRAAAASTLAMIGERIVCPA